MSKFPSKLKMLTNFAIAIAEHASSGFRNVTEEQFIQRMEACKACPNLVPDENGEGLGRCSLCGCWVESKGAWESQVCPDDPKRWPKIKIGENGKPLKLKKDERESDNPKAGN